MSMECSDSTADRRSVIRVCGERSTAYPRSCTPQKNTLAFWRSRRTRRSILVMQPPENRRGDEQVLGGQGRPRLQVHWQEGEGIEGQTHHGMECGGRTGRHRLRMPHPRRSWIARAPAGLGLDLQARIY